MDMVELELLKGIYTKGVALQAGYPMRILVIKEGKGVLSMNSGDYALVGGRIFFIPEEGLVRLEGKIESGYWLSFSSAIYAEFLLQHLDPAAKNLFLNLTFRDLSIEESLKTYSLLEQLKREISNKKDVQFLSQYISLFLGYSAGLDGYLTALTIDQLQQVMRFRAILEQYYKTEKNTAFYAKGMGLSIHKFNSFLNDVMNKSFSSLIKDRVMREAEELLMNSEYSIDEIAEILGFTKAENFNNTFKRYKGVSAIKFSKLAYNV
jgi:AraC-like DNA-binding protein